MSAHTPGPWYFDEDDRAVGPVSNKSIGVCSIMLADGNAARYHFGEQSIANANLIAAAPDLLEALQLFVNSMRSPPTGPNMTHEFDIGKAERAIAKALTGESK